MDHNQCGLDLHSRGLGSRQWQGEFHRKGQFRITPALQCCAKGVQAGLDFADSGLAVEIQEDRLFEIDETAIQQDRGTTQICSCGDREAVPLAGGGNLLARDWRRHVQPKEIPDYTIG